MTRVVAVIQARLGSTRLPGKSLADIAGKPMLEHVVERMRACACIDEIVLATTAEASDAPLVRLARTLGIRVYEGSTDDVLDRTYRAAVMARAEVIVRVTGDDPFKDAAVTEQVVRRLLEEKADYASNTTDPTFPEGIDIEAFTMIALERAWREARLSSEREHVTPYIWTHPKLFTLVNVAHSVDLSAMRWTVDYPQDLAFARAVYGELYHGRPFGMKEVLDLLERKPELARINEGIARNAGYQRSLERDRAPNDRIQRPTDMHRISDLERRYVAEVLDTEFRSSLGSGMTRRLEQLFSELCGVRYAVAHVNGTATLHSSLVAAGVGPGDEVIVPPLTMASTAMAVLQANAVPVFADIDPETWTIDPEGVAACLSGRTKAIMPVALYGLMPDMDPLMALASDRGLPVIEDDAECMLGMYKGRVAGSIGHLSSFSFQSSKQVTAGEGGMVVTDNEELALAVRRFNSLGYAGVATTKAKITKEDIQDPGYARHVSMGYNYRMAELCAAVVLAQTERVTELIAVRTRSAAALTQAISGCEWLIPQATPPGYVNTYWTLAVRLADDAPTNWHGFRDRFRSGGGDGIYSAWRLNYLEPAFVERRLYPNGQPFGEAQRRGGIQQVYAPGLCQVAERVQPRLLQFKTNYWNAADSERQAEALAHTVATFA